MKWLKFLTVGIVFMLLAVMAAGCPATDNTTPSSNSPSPDPPKPAEYVVSDLTLPSGAILAGAPVSVAVTIQNVGEVSGTYNAVLKVEGTEVGNRELTLSGGESESISFSIVVDTGGSYQVSVGDTSGTFEILPIPLSSVVLALDDLPSGFALMSAVEIDMDEAAVDFAQIGGESIDYFGFISGTSLATFEMVFGFNIYPLTALEQTTLNLGLDDTDGLMAEFVTAAAGGMPLESFEILPELSEIGDKSIGIRVHIESEGIAMVIDTVIFRSGSIASVLYVVWLEGYTPPVSSEELAHILADKVAAALASSSGEFTVTLLE